MGRTQEKGTPFVSMTGRCLGKPSGELLSKLYRHHNKEEYHGLTGKTMRKLL